jgi:hypothetical protein
MKKDNIYKSFQCYIKDKDTAVLSFVENSLAKTQSMFKYEGLPESIPQDEIEKLLQTTGKCFVTKVDGVLYALSGGLGGEPDVYNRPTLYTVANPALKLNKTYKVETDGVLIKNDTNGNSLLPIIGKYAVLHTDGLISLNTASVLTRITMLISASDDKTKQSADLFLQKILDGEFSIIGENAFFKGVNMQTAPTTNSVYITQLIEMIQYYKASLYNELGLNANYNMKRERLNLGEVSMNVDALLPYVDNMLNERQKAVTKINEKYGTDISVSLNSSWNLEHENFETLIKNTDPDPDKSETDTEQAGTETEQSGTETEQSGTEQEQTGTETEQSGTETEKTETEKETEQKKETEVENEV